jgi:hypothetical protein
MATCDPPDLIKQPGMFSESDIEYFQDVCSDPAIDLWTFDDVIQSANGEVLQSLADLRGEHVQLSETAKGVDVLPGIGVHSWGLFETFQGANDDHDDDDEISLADIAWEEFSYPEPLPGDVGEGDDFLLPDDRLTREDRARQVAGEIGALAEWSFQEIAPLIEALAYHRCHHATRKALTALIVENGMTSRELAIVFELRCYWPMYGYSRSYEAGEAVDGWESLPWWLALRAVRQLRTDNPEEAMYFIEDCFEDWSAQPFRMAIAGYRSQPYFLGYLEHVLNHMHDMEKRWGQAMPPGIDFQLFPIEDDAVRRGSPAWCELQELGLPSQRAREIWLSSDDDKAS